MRAIGCGVGRFRDAGPTPEAEYLAAKILLLRLPRPGRFTKKRRRKGKRGMVGGRTQKRHGKKEMIYLDHPVPSLDHGRWVLIRGGVKTVADKNMVAEIKFPAMNFPAFEFHPLDSPVTTTLGEKQIREGLHLWFWGPKNLSGWTTCDWQFGWNSGPEHPKQVPRKKRKSPGARVNEKLIGHMRKPNRWCWSIGRLPRHGFATRVRQKPPQNLFSSRRVYFALSNYPF